MSAQVAEVETAHIDDAEFDEMTARGQRLVEMRNLAFGIADTATLHLLRTQATEVQSGGHLWLDTHQAKRADCAEPLPWAARYLVLRGIAERNPAFPHLVRVVVDPVTDLAAASRLPQ